MQPIRVLLVVALLLGLALFNQQKIEYALADWGFGVGEKAADVDPASLADLRYDNEPLDTLISEIASLTDDATLLTTEFSWLTHRSKSCPSDPLTQRYRSASRR
jgi:hypothetical protein